MNRIGVKQAISGNSYCGRGIVIGTTSNQKCASAYFIMGRSDNSRNRVFVKDGENLMIKPFDESKVTDPSLIIYYPVRKHGQNLIVTNGDQTDTIYDFLADGKSFEDALRTREYEPDAPNYTPRISGIVEHAKDGFKYKLSILKREDADNEACQRNFFEYSSVPGIGHLIHTYVKDGNPLPSFEGEPTKIEIENDIDTFASSIWESLDSENKISLYVRYSDFDGGNVEERIINKFGR